MVGHSGSHRELRRVFKGREAGAARSPEAGAAHAQRGCEGTRRRLGRAIEQSAEAQEGQVQRRPAIVARYLSPLGRTVLGRNRTAVTRALIRATLTGLMSAALVGAGSPSQPDMNGRIALVMDSVPARAPASAWSDPPRPARVGSGNFNGNGNTGNFNGNGNSGSFNGNGNRSNANGNGSARDGTGNGPHRR